MSEDVVIIHWFLLPLGALNSLSLKGSGFAIIFYRALFESCWVVLKAEVSFFPLLQN